MARGVPATGKGAGRGVIAGAGAGAAAGGAGAGAGSVPVAPSCAATACDSARRRRVSSGEKGEVGAAAVMAAAPGAEPIASVFRRSVKGVQSWPAQNATEPRSAPAQAM
jgi:hypothetical protein